MSAWDAWTKSKRIKKACPHHEFGENHFNFFLFYDEHDNQTQALLVATLGGQLSKLPQNQVRAKIEEVVWTT